MATATQSSKTNPLAGIMDTEDSVPARARVGRSSAELDAIKIELQSSVKDGKARSFKNITDQKEREVWARKVRGAGAALNIEVSTIFDAEAQKLFWGPSEVVKKLQGNSTTV